MGDAQKRDLVEPSAEMRAFAANLKQMYVALVKEGFTERQALEIIGKTLAASFGSNKES